MDWERGHAGSFLASVRDFRKADLERDPGPLPTLEHKAASDLSEDPRLRPEHDPNDALFHPLGLVTPAFCACAMLCGVTCFCFVFRAGAFVLEMRFMVSKDLY